MEDMRKEENRLAEGFCFYTDQDARMAELERKKIEYLKERMDYSRPETILKIYDGAIHDRIFKTPVGIIFLKQVQEFLLKQEQIPKDQILPIPLYQTYGGMIRENQNPVRKRVKPSKKEEKEKRFSAFFSSVALNIVLVAAVITMFVITLKSDQPNILNYERVLTDRYASWEQELTERERIIREKERELAIEEQ